jgi:CarD family transcriptional regulator
MYQIGDLVVYSSTGVCRIDGFCHPDGNSSKLYYRLSPFYQSGVVHLPASMGETALRPVMTAAEAEEHLTQVSAIPVEICRERTVQQLSQRYQAILRSDDSLQLLSLILSIQEKRRQAEAQNRRLGMVDERYSRQAEKILFGELAVALDISIEDVPARIAAHLHKHK